MNIFIKNLSLAAILALGAEANTETIANFPMDTLCTHLNMQENPNQLDLPLISIAMCGESDEETDEEETTTSTPSTSPKVPVIDKPIETQTPVVEEPEETQTPVVEETQEPEETQTPVVEEPEEPKVPIIIEPTIPDSDVTPLPEPTEPVKENEAIMLGSKTKPATIDETDTKVAQKDTGTTTQAPQESDDGTKTTIAMSDENGQSDKKTQITVPTDVNKVVTQTESGTQVDLESTKTKTETTVNNNGTIDAKVTNKDTGKELDIKSSALGTDINVKEDGSFEMSVNNTDVVGKDVKVEDVDKDETISESTTTLTSDGSFVEAKVVIKTTDPLTGEETTTTKTIDTPVTENTKVSITDDGSIQLKEESINSVQVIDPTTNELTDADVNSLSEIKPDGTTIHIVELVTDNGINIQTSATSNLAGSKTETTENGLHTTASVTTHIVQNGESKEVHVELEVVADNNGKATHSMNIINDEGISTTTTASSDLVGASTIISNDGEIETSINLGNGENTAELKAVANADGSSEHSVKFSEPQEGQTLEDVTTRASSKIVGAQTKITTTGGIDTSVNEVINGETIKAIVETDINGNSITKFEKYDSDGNLLGVQETTKSATLFEPGNKIILENRDGKTVIDVTAQVSGTIEF